MAGAGQKRGRRGIIGGYWGGYNLLSSSPTPRALPGKAENLTPPAAGQKRTGWSTASADRRPEQQRTTRRRPGLFLLRRLPACPACRISSPARAGCCRQPPRGKAGKYPGSAGHSAWILRPPPAPGRISTASAAHDDHAPAPALPHLHSAHSLPALPDLTAAAQPPAPPPRRTSPPAPPTCRLHRCRLPDDPPRSTPQNGHFAPPPEGSDSPPNGIEL